MYHINRMVILFKRRYSRHFAKSERHLHPVTLLCRVSINNIPASEFSTKQKLLPQHWDQASQCVLPECPDADRINRELNRLRTRLDVIHNRYEFEEQEVSAEEIVGELLRKRTGQTTPRSRPSARKKGLLFTDLLTAHLAKIREDVVDDSPDRQHGIVLETWRVYNRYTNNIRRYLSEESRLMATDLDADWMDGLLRWMQREQYDSYYTAKHLFFIKTALDWGIRTKLILYNPVATYDVQRGDRDDDELVFLYADEVVRFETTDFAQFPAVADIAPALDRIRDAFLMMMEIGQHYADYKAFVQSPATHLRVVRGVAFFRKRRQKTKQWALVPVSQRMSRLEAKYGGYNNLPTPCNKTFNLYLKVIAAICEIPKNLTTKAARKTFADTAINEEDLDLDTVARMMGLKNTEFIKKYARIDERRILKKKGLLPDAE